MKKPVHPGEFLKHEVVRAHQLTTPQAAAALGISRQALHRLLSGEAALTAEMALRFEKAFGVSMETLLRMQLSFDIAAMKARYGELDIQRYRMPVAAPEPQAELEL